MNNREEGVKGEQLACEFLVSKGYKILQRNFLCKLGEIDIIAKQGVTLVFVEVKSRNSGKFGVGYDAITKTKMRKIVNAARYYISMRGLYNTPARFDVVGVLRDKCEIIENAFDLNDI